MQFDTFVDNVLCEQLAKAKKFDKEMAANSAKIRKIEEKLLVDKLVRIRIKEKK